MPLGWTFHYFFHQTKEILRLGRLARFPGLGAAGIVKMNIMPSLIYLLQALLLLTPNSFLHVINRTLLNLLRSQEHPRLPQAILSSSETVKRHGTAGCDPLSYGLSLTRVLDWCRHGQIKQRVQLEQAIVGIPLNLLPCCRTNLAVPIHTHPTVGENWRVCSKVFWISSLSSDPSLL